MIIIYDKKAKRAGSQNHVAFPSLLFGSIFVEVGILNWWQKVNKSTLSRSVSIIHSCRYKNILCRFERCRNDFMLQNSQADAIKNDMKE